MPEWYWMIYTTSETGTWPGVKLGVPQRIKEKNILQMGKIPRCTLWWTNIAMENHHFSWENSLYISIFNSYVSLPEGIYYKLMWCLPFNLRPFWGAFPSPALQLSQLLRPSCGDIWVSVMLGKRTRFIHRSIILLPIWLFLGDFTGKPTVSHTSKYYVFIVRYVKKVHCYPMIIFSYIPIISPWFFPYFLLKNGWLLMVLADTPPCQGAHLLWFWPRRWLRVGGFTFYRFIHVSYVSLMCKDLRILFFFWLWLKKVKIS